MIIDVTEHREAEAAARRSEVQEEIIRAQEEMLRALSTPLVPLDHGAVLMPHVGAVDRARASGPARRARWWSSGWSSTG